MALTNRHKVMMGLCAVGVAFFIYDRVQNKPATEPDAAAASTAAGGVDAAGALPTVMPAAAAAHADGTAGQNRRTMAERLEKIVAGNRVAFADVRDAFRPSATWLPVPEKGSDPAPTPADDPDKARAEAFRQKHSLQAVMVGPDGQDRRAVIDNQCLKIGQKFDGFELVAVGDRSAEMVSGNIRLTFELPAKE